MFDRPALEWVSHGKLSALRAPDHGGVYLLVHEGKFKRVIYVGTSSNLAQRLATHLDGYLRGNRSIWKITGKDDAYQLMTAWHLGNYVKYFQQLARQGRLWGTTTLNTQSPVNLLAREQRFNDEWFDFLCKEYLPCISVWSLKLHPYNAKSAALIESAIQQRLVNTFRLGRFFNHKDLSILGKIEFNSKLVRIKRAFANAPDVDDASKLLFASLDAKAIPDKAVAMAMEQLQDELRERAAAKHQRAEERQRLLKRYPRQGSRWEPIEIEKLRTMVVDFGMQPGEISRILGRKASSIRLHIERLDKLTASEWRKPRPFTSLQNSGA